MDIAINLNLWLAFVAASALLAFIPGPIVTLVIANILSQGSRAGVINVLGTFSGTALLFVIGGLGVAWILAGLSHWFDLLRGAGAIYLSYLGIKQWFAKPENLADQQSVRPGRSLFWQGLVVAVTNLKTILCRNIIEPSQGFLNALRKVDNRLNIIDIPISDTWGRRIGHRRVL